MKAAYFVDPEFECLTLQFCRDSGLVIRNTKLKVLCSNETDSKMKKQHVFY